MAARPESARAREEVFDIADCVAEGSLCLSSWRDDALLRVQSFSVAAVYDRRFL
jgi:hypothetical protein